MKENCVYKVKFTAPRTKGNLKGLGLRVGLWLKEKLITVMLLKKDVFTLLRQRYIIVIFFKENDACSAMASSCSAGCLAFSTPSPSPRIIQHRARGAPLPMSQFPSNPSGSFAGSPDVQHLLVDRSFPAAQGAGFQQVAATKKL